MQQAFVQTRILADIRTDDERANSPDMGGESPIDPVGLMQQYQDLEAESIVLNISQLRR
jgi:hypothetical protein